jgi:hypothetical protein
MDWIRSHKAMLSVTIGGFLFAAAAGGKTYTAMAGAGYSDDIARLTLRFISLSSCCGPWQSNW